MQVLFMVWVLYVAGVVQASHAKYVRDASREDFKYADTHKNLVTHIKKS
jgi:hypothetical protein